MLPVAGLLLTGGRSRRMGTAKAELVVAGEGLAVRGERLLRAVTDPVLEVGPGYTGLATVAEGQPGRGPLAALAAAARCGDLPAGRPVLVLAVDMPFVTEALLRLLAGHAAAPGVSVVPVDADGRDQPLCARWSADALAVAADLVDRGRRSLRDLVEVVAVARVGPGEWQAVAGGDAFFDVDTPSDLARLT